MLVIDPRADASIRPYKLNKTPQRLFYGVAGYFLCNCICRCQAGF